MAVIAPNTLHAQRFSCGNDFLPPPSTPESFSCSRSSSTFQNKYKTPGFYTPNKSNISVKTILVNLVVILRDDSSGGLHPSPHAKAEWQEMLDSLNNRMTNVAPRIYDVECPVPTDYISDTKIRFEANAVYFIADSNLFNYNDPLRCYNTYVINTFISNTYPESEKGINVIAHPLYWNNAAGAECGGTIITNQVYPLLTDSTRLWHHPFAYGHLVHEFGHAFELYHLYKCNVIETTHISNFDFLDDVFGNCPDSCETVVPIDCGGNPLPPCTPASGYVCHFSSDSCWLNRMPPGDTIYPIMSGLADWAHYISPKQAGHMHRSLMIKGTYGNNPMHQYVKEKYPAPNDYVITSDETWDFEIKMYQNIVIDSGATLTIQCKVYMPIEGKIIIKPGGRLIIDGGTVTNAHAGEFWEGVEVWGNTNKSQFPLPSGQYEQGLLRIINGGTLENAHEAVRVWKSGDYATMGGIVRCDGAVFKNNWRSVEFVLYQNFHPTTMQPWSNLSYFNNTSFIVDDDFMRDDFHAQVTMWGVDGVGFTRCAFENNKTSGKVFSDTSLISNNAIYTIDAGYSIDGVCNATITPYQPCPASQVDSNYFSGFNVAVNATGAGNIQSIYIDQARFRDNHYGVYISKLDNVSVTRSHFTVGGSSTNPLDNNYGLYTSNATGYRIEANTFAPATGSPSPIGLKILNSGSNNNLVYNNSFNNLREGDNAAGKNRNPNNNFMGLQFNCNTHSGNGTVDMSVDNEPNFSSSDDGILVYQGAYFNNTQHSAGNVFSNAAYDIINEPSSQIIYFHTGGQTEPIDILGNVVTNDVSPNAHPCPSHFGSGGPALMSIPLSQPAADDLIDDFDDAKSDYTALLDTYNDSIDGGDTEDLLQDIENHDPTDPWGLRDVMLSHTPYLSTTALKTAAMSGILADNMLLEVCLASPVATWGEDFISFMGDTIPNPLPAYMLEDIRDNWGTYTDRRALEAKIAGSKSRMAAASNLLITD